MTRTSRIAVTVAAIAALVIGGWTLWKIAQIAERTSHRPVTVDQIREIVLEALQQGGGGMLMTPVTGPDGRVHEVETRFRESGHEEEDDDEFIARHLERVRKFEKALQ